MWVSWAPRGHRVLFGVRKAVVLADLETTWRRVLVRGDVCCAAFAPDGKAIAYARGNGEVGRAFRSDVYSMRIDNARTTRLTRDGHSDRPVWGRGWIAYSHFHGQGAGGSPIRDLRIMRPDGSEKRRIAGGHDNQSQAQLGIEPVAFAGDGTRLLACLAAEFECAPATFDIRRGRRHVLRAGRPAELAYAIAINRDGTQVLAEAGGLEGPHRVVVVPFVGGKPCVLARNASNPTWVR
jgi:hypothetical protein